MNKNEEKLAALKVLKEVIECVNEATEAISDFAEAYGYEPAEDDEISLPELAYIVGKITHKSPFCVEEILRTALEFMAENGISTIVEEDDSDDSEDE